MEENKESRAKDDLRAINGIGPKFAKALNQIGIVRYVDLAQHTAVSLSELLAEKTKLKISPDRIEKDDWLGQAGKLAAETAPESSSSPTKLSAALDTDDPIIASEWRQHAGFSLFFDYEVDPEGKQNWQTRIWQTRVYHDESGEQVELSGIKPDTWGSWIIEKAQLPVQITAVPPEENVEPAAAEVDEDLELAEARLEILDVQVSEMGASETLPQKHLRAEVRFQLSGSNLSRLVTQKTGLPSVRLNVQAVDLETGLTDLIETSNLPLQADVYEYVSELELPLPKIGNYELHHDLSLDLSMGAINAHYEGPVLKVIP